MVPTGIVTQSSRTVLIPMFPSQKEGIAAAGLAELPLLIGKVVINETFDPVTGEAVSETLSLEGRVVDVCELLPRQ